MIFQSISGVILGIVLGCLASWKLTLVILCFSPILILAGNIRGRKVAKTGQSKEKDTFAKQGGQVFKKSHHFQVFLNIFHFSMRLKPLSIFELLLLFIKKIVLLVSMKMHSIKNSSIVLI